MPTISYVLKTLDKKKIKLTERSRGSYYGFYKGFELHFLADSCSQQCSIMGIRHYRMIHDGKTDSFAWEYYDSLKELVGEVERRGSDSLEQERLRRLQATSEEVRTNG